MIDEVKKHLVTVEAFQADTHEAVEAFRISYAGKKGILNALFAAFREVAPAEKKEYGQMLNSLKQAVADKSNHGVEQASAEIGESFKAGSHDGHARRPRSTKKGKGLCADSIY